MLISLKKICYSSSVVQCIELADIDVHCVCVIREFDSLRGFVSFSLHEILFSHHSDFDVSDSICSSLNVSTVKSRVIIIAHLNCVSCMHVLCLKLYLSENYSFCNEQLCNV